MNTQDILQKKLRMLTGNTARLELYPVGGGSINETFRIRFGDDHLFCKINSATKFPQLFSREASGLKTLGAAGKIKTPTVVDCFEKEGYQFLLLESIEQGERTTGFWKQFGEQLAALHKVKSETCGLDEDNYMGSVPQQNHRVKDWCSFFSDYRLTPMINRCAKATLLSSNDQFLFEKLISKLSAIFDDEKPSLLHGDLWSGNFLCDANAQPVLIDPAVYYGQRSMDLGMTTLFGGFRQPFYEAYQYHYPLPKNHEEQWADCNLYPLLIHLYLFGAGYLSSIRDTLKKFT
ncbi:fructosamine kinase family protein [Flavisolibacter sp. BT320]|nr:fructosamine kinase family protein [Flavisolibacter longurius]